MKRAHTAPMRLLLSCELRRLWRGTLPWLFVLAVPALWLFVGRWQAPALERHLELHVYLAVVGLALSAFTAHAAQRDRRSGADEVILAWPLDSWRLYLARTLALGTLTLTLWLEAALPSLAYTAISYAGAARAAGVPLPLAAVLRDAGLIALSLAASLVGAQALGQLAAALLPGLAGLVGLILHRAFALVGPRLVLGTLQWPYALLASPEFHWGGWPRLAAGLQVSLYTDLFLAHQAFWAAGGLGALLALAFLFQPRRDAPRIPSRALAAGALLATLAAGLPFVALERRYVAAHHRALAVYGEAVKPPYEPSEGPGLPGLEQAAEVPVRYELALDLTRPPEARIQATIELATGLDTPLDALAFTLRRAFEVEEVWLDGAPVPFEREGDLLRIHPAQAISARTRRTVTVRYHGHIEDWRLDAHETPAALAAPEFIWLPATWGWYPVPGEHRLTWEYGLSSIVFRALADRTQPFNDAEPVFDVTVLAPAGIRYLAGFEAEDKGHWRLQERRNLVTLLGGNWWPREEGPVSYAVRFEELDTWQQSTVDLQRLLAAAVDWTGVGPLSVVPSPLPLINAADLTLLDAQAFGPVYQAGAGAGQAGAGAGQAGAGAGQPGLARERLAWSAGAWLYGLLRYQPRFLAPDAPELDTGHYAAGEELHALRAYAVDRVFEDAFGLQVVAGPGVWQGEPPVKTPLVEAWVARTPVAAQKEALRRLFRTALLRPLSPADLSFLHEGGEE